MVIDSSLLNNKLCDVLNKGNALKVEGIPESIRMISIHLLDISQRVVTLITSLGVDSIWDLVHLGKLGVRPQKD